MATTIITERDLPHTVELHMAGTAKMWVTLYREDRHIKAKAYTTAGHRLKPTTRGFVAGGVILTVVGR